MKSHDARNLLGGYAAGSLTGKERRRLFEAALEDQELFEALAAEEPLRELLSDPATRTRLIPGLEPARHVAWFRRPLVWSLSGGLAALIVTAGIVLQQREAPTPKATQVAQVAQEPPPAAPMSAPAPAAATSRSKRVKSLSSPPPRLAPPPALTANRPKSPPERAEDASAAPPLLPAGPATQPLIVLRPYQPERPAAAGEGVGGTWPEKRGEALATGFRRQADAPRRTPAAGRAGFALSSQAPAISRWSLQKRAEKRGWVAVAGAPLQPGDLVRVMFMPAVSGELQVRERDVEGVWRPLLKPGFRVEARRAYPIPADGEFRVAAPSAMHLEIVLTPADGSPAVTIPVDF